MAEPASDQDFLMTVLNSTPVVDGVPADDFADPARARAWLASVGGTGTGEELRQVLGSGPRFRRWYAVSSRRPFWPRSCGARRASRA